MEVLVLALWIIVLMSPSTEAKPLIGFSIDLIHRDSPLSPFYDSSMNQSEALRKAAMRSISRYNTLFHHVSGDGIKSQTTIIPNQGDYLMEFSVGNPPSGQFGIVDTGSDMIWIQCQPCNDCYKQNSPIFNPISSSTYKIVACGTHACDLVRINACGASGACRYEINYSDNSSTVGELASDTISFGPYREVVSPNTFFGCGRDNTGIFRPAGTGLVGLGQGHLSLISQLGDRIDHKFSYCLVSRFSKFTSKLKFGWEATLSGNGIVSAPLVDKYPRHLYHLSIKEIYIGKDAVEPSNSKTSDMIVDSGTTLTFLETSLYESFELAVIEAYGDDRVPISNPPSPLTLCYLDGTTKDLPDITFNFFGANKGLRLNTFNVFSKFNNLLCLMVAPTKGYSVLGNIAQMDFKVLYDLQERTVSFKPADCIRE